MQIVNRLRQAWHVLRGRPAVVNMNIVGGIRVGPDSDRCIISGNRFWPDAP